MSEYKKAIILGDDPLPTPDFFEFGNWSLKNLNQHLLAIFVDITSSAEVFSATANLKPARRAPPTPKLIGKFSTLAPVVRARRAVSSVGPSLATRTVNWRDRRS